jgi:O-6-methylguanine DNA methyltransferase
MAKNKFPIIIPCHRVIKSNGSLGNYTGGVDIKKSLLSFESDY